MKRREAEGRQSFSARRREFPIAMYQALFDDVRPEWKKYLAKREQAGAERGAPVPLRVTSEMPARSWEEIGAVRRALFDDVRPAWEEQFARKAHRAAA